MVKRTYYDPDPDPFIGIGTIITIVIIGVVVGGTSLAIQNPSFFTQVMWWIDPASKDLAEKDLENRKEFWRYIFIIALAVCVIAGLLIFYRYNQRKKESKRRRYIRSED